MVLLWRHVGAFIQFSNWTCTPEQTRAESPISIWVQLLTEVRNEPLSNVYLMMGAFVRIDSDINSRLSHDVIFVT